jgi:DNA polymerase III alpha subunit (gram-positive type)
MQYVIYVIDTETTGLDPLLHDIIEISLYRVNFLNGKELDGEQRTWLIKAARPENIQADALAKNGHKREDILCQTDFGKEHYQPVEKVIEEIEEWIATDNMSAHDRVFAGQNPMFDFNHMEETWRRNNSSDTFPFLTGINKLIVDTKQIALFFDICLGQKRDRYNLGSLVKSFGVKKGKAHRADEDTRMTKDLLFVFINSIFESINGKFSLSKEE